MTEADLFTWVTGAGRPLANNTVRQRLSVARTFLTWCSRAGLAADLGPQLAPLRRQYPKTYGKVQAKNPGRWLTREEAYELLIGACRDGTWTGLRDEIGLRLGLSGMRLSEIVHLSWGGFDRVTRRITFFGKARKPRTVTAGAALVDALERYRTEYESRVGRPVTDTDPVLCRRRPGPGSTDLRWGTGITDDTLATAVGFRARQAGLGHVAPHDLRRTAAGILHSAVNPDGAHHFDLLDIQRVLGHSDPATTMRSYLEPMRTEVLDRAATFLD